MSLCPLGDPPPPPDLSIFTSFTRGEVIVIVLQYTLICQFIPRQNEDNSPAINSSFTKVIMFSSRSHFSGVESTLRSPRRLQFVVLLKFVTSYCLQCYVLPI